MFPFEYARVPSKSLNVNWNTYNIMQSLPLENNLLPQERQILLSMWKRKAIGSSAISLDDLRARLSDEVKENYNGYLKNLENKLLIEVFHHEKEDVASMTPLGLAYIRQTQDDGLRLIAGEREKS